MGEPWLKQHCIVVIGGTSGMGLSAAKAFITEGARVVVTGPDVVSTNEAQTILGPSAKAMVADARKEGTAEEAIGVCRESFGAFHGLYHVAGGSGRKLGDGPLHEMTTEGWAQTLDWNLSSTMLSNRAAIRSWLDRKESGSILNMGTALAEHPAPTFFATHAYAAAKSAVVGFSKSVAAYYAQHNIRVNVVAPGLTDTPMAKRAVNDPAIMAFVKSKQRLDGGRSASPSDLDGAAVFLLSPSASFITGQVLCVDGGWGIVSEGQIST
jgi:NAD(P)-dependent dehydrogenase (short-subunit alcohol dehydrogenase family)